MTKTLFNGQKNLEAWSTAKLKNKDDFAFCVKVDGLVRYDYVLELDTKEAWKGALFGKILEIGEVTHAKNGK